MLSCLVSVKASCLAPADDVVQLSLFPDIQKAQRRADIDRTLDKLRDKYGYFIIRKAVTLLAPRIGPGCQGGYILPPPGGLYEGV